MEYNNNDPENVNLNLNLTAAQSANNISTNNILDINTKCTVHNSQNDFNQLPELFISSPKYRRKRLLKQNTAPALR